MTRLLSVAAIALGCLVIAPPLHAQQPSASHRRQIPPVAQTISLAGRPILRVQPRRTVPLPPQEQAGPRLAPRSVRTGCVQLAQPLEFYWRSDMRPVILAP